MHADELDIDANLVRQQLRAQGEAGGRKNPSI
jgi:hypothetical protein